MSQSESQAKNYCSHKICRGDAQKILGEEKPLLNPARASPGLHLSRIHTTLVFLLRRNQAWDMSTVRGGNAGEMHRWILGYSAKDDAGRTWGEVDWRNLPLGNIRKTSTGGNHRSVRRVVATGDRLGIRGIGAIHIFSARYGGDLAVSSIPPTRNSWRALQIYFWHQYPLLHYRFWEALQVASYLMACSGKARPIGSMASILNGREGRLGSPSIVN